MNDNIIHCLCWWLLFFGKIFLRSIPKRASAGLFSSKGGKKLCRTTLSTAPICIQFVSHIDVRYLIIHSHNPPIFNKFYDFMLQKVLNLLICRGSARLKNYAFLFQLCQILYSSTIRQGLPQVHSVRHLIQISRNGSCFVMSISIKTASLRSACRRRLELANFSFMASKLVCFAWTDDGRGHSTYGSWF